jgi:Beta-ketoacyl synthase, N-terminal domain
MTTDRLAEPLFLAAAACVGPWGVELDDVTGWSHEDRGVSPALPPVPRFVESSFPRLIAYAVDQVTAALDEGGTTGFVLATAFGDVTTADVASRRLVGGQAHNPLLFYQSIPNSILGHLSKASHLTGPLCCLSAPAMLLTHALVTAELTLMEGAADRILIVGVDLAVSDRIAAIADARAAAGRPLAAVAPAADIAVVLAVQRHPGGSGQRGAWIAAQDGPAASPAVASRTGSMRAFVDVCRAFAGDRDEVAMVADFDAAGQHAGYAVSGCLPQGRIDGVARQSGGLR